jgi:hypothetical protein
MIFLTQKEITIVTLTKLLFFTISLIFFLLMIFMLITKKISFSKSVVTLFFINELMITFFPIFYSKDKLIWFVYTIFIICLILVSIKYLYVYLSLNIIKTLAFIFIFIIIDNAILYIFFNENIKNERDLLLQSRKNLKNRIKIVDE